MGYIVDMTVVVTIPAANVEACLAAINALHAQVDERGSGGVWQGGKKTHANFAWVDDMPEGGFESLPHALAAWRYEAEILDDGSCAVYAFGGQKWGDDEQLFKAIAPFVVPGSTVECAGEDGAHWRYLFEDGHAVEQPGEVRWGFGRPL